MKGEIFCLCKMHKILIVLIIFLNCFILLTKGIFNHQKLNRRFNNPQFPQEFYERIRWDLINLNYNDTSIYDALIENEVDWNNVQHMSQFHHKVPSKYTARSRSPLSPRIINGKEANRNQFLYQAGIFIYSFRGIFFCGGTIISSDYIVTAAHCVESAIFSQVIVGTHNIIEPEPGSQKIVAFDFKIHQLWNRLEVLNDIALIKLSKSITFNERIQPVKLPSKSMEHETFVGEIGTVSGWGITHDSNNDISTILRFAKNPILSNKECSEKMEDLYIPATQVCMSGINNRGTCSGDSGGPLTIYNNTLFGIVSYGLIYGCELGYPSAFTRVSSYLDWISLHSGVRISE